MFVKTIAVELQDPEIHQLDQAVELCGFSSKEELVREAVRRFLTAHTSEAQKRFIQEDVAWGLHGRK